METVQTAVDMVVYSSWNGPWSLGSGLVVLMQVAWETLTL